MSLAVDDIVVMKQTGSKAKVVRVDTDGCGLVFLADIEYAKQHGLPIKLLVHEVWFPNELFDKEASS